MYTCFSKQIILNVSLHLFPFILILVDVLLKPAGDAPIMKKKKWAVDRHKKFSWISEFIRKYLKTDANESIVCFTLNSIWHFNCARTFKIVSTLKKKKKAIIIITKFVLNYL